MSTESELPAKRPQERALVGSSIVVRGNIEGAQDLVVEGEVDGTIELRDNTVTIGKGGRVKANIYAQNIVVEGDVTGDLFASEKVIVMKSGNVRGNITAPRASLEDGAKLKGSIDMDPQASESIGRKADKRKDDSAPMPDPTERPSGMIHA